MNKPKMDFAVNSMRMPFSAPPDYRQLVSRADLVCARPAAKALEGFPLGNGRMGTLVWTSPAALQFQINRVDVFAVNAAAAGLRYPGPADYGGSCGRVTISLGGEPFHAGPAYREHLALYDAQCAISGEGVQARCWISADHDLMMIAITDEREQPQAAQVTLSMWREPQVRHGGHLAEYAFRETPEGMAVVQTFREKTHYCASAVVIRVPGAAEQMMPAGERACTLRLPPARGTRYFFVASAASWDEQVDAAITARRILDTAACQSIALLEAEHMRWWHAFWERTFVDVSSPDGRGEKAAQNRTLFLYHMAASSRGRYPPKWNGSIFLTEGDARDWGTQYWLWTTEMLYFPLLAADAVDLTEPFFNMYCRHLPAAECAARQRWNAGGAFFPEVVPFDGPHALPEHLVPEYQAIFLQGKPKAGISAQLAEQCRFEYHLSTLLYTKKEVGKSYPCGGYSWISHLVSSGAELAVHAWWRYRHTGDITWLSTHAYPLLRGVMEFYRTITCKDADGKCHIQGTNAHEDFWGVTDGIMDMAAIRGTAPLAIRASEILHVDPELRGQWQEFLDHLASYPLGNDPRAKELKGGVLADNVWAAGLRGVVDGSHNPEDVWLTPIFPFENWTLETRDPSLDAIALRTLELAPRHHAVLQGAALTTALRSPIAAVRAGQGEDLPNILERYAAAFAPLANGFSLFEHYTPDTQAHSIEHLGLLTMTLQEALLQSVSPHPGEPEIISVFPAWPRQWDASFRLLARGGFEVAAVHTKGTVQAVEIRSRRGEPCRLRNPWPGNRCLIRSSAGSEYKSTGEIVRFATAAGHCYYLQN